MSYYAIVQLSWTALVLAIVQLFWRYTAKSAYKAQLQGTFSTFNGSWIWKAFAEGKQKFFTWLLLQNKILTADNLIIRNWPCNEVCTFCDQELETATHLSCYFAREAWLKVSEWTGFSSTPISLDEVFFADWWHKTLAAVTGRQRRNVAAIIMYTVWNLWKERNRRIFDAKTGTPGLVLGFIKEDVALRRAACGTPEFEINLVHPW